MNDPGAADQAELVRRAAAGRPGAWSELVSRYTPMLRARTSGYRLQEADALDVAQVTWLRLAENIDRIHTPEHLAGWLVTVASHECQRVLRENGRTVPTDDAGAAPEPGPGPEERTVGRDVATALQAALAGLPPKRRLLLAALFAEERRPYAEIARDLDIPVGSIGPTRARSLTELRRILRSAGIAAAA